MAILRSATRFDQENWFQMEIDKEVPSCEVTGILDGEPIDFSGGDDPAYTLIASEDFDVSTTSTTITSVGHVTINNSDWADKALFVVIRDKAGIRNDYFAYSVAFAMAQDTGTESGFGTCIYRCVNDKIANVIGKRGLYTSVISTNATTTTISIASKYDSAYSGTIDGTYAVEVYALEYPPNGVFNL